MSYIKRDGKQDGNKKKYITGMWDGIGGEDGKKTGTELMSTPSLFITDSPDPVRFINPNFGYVEDFTNLYRSRVIGIRNVDRKNVWKITR
jgi:hypothetical protein